MPIVTETSSVTKSTISKRVSKSTSKAASDDTSIEEVISNKTSKTTYFHTFAVHTEIRASPLSKESEEQNYRGFLNLAILLLAVTTIRLVIENYIKYGILVSYPFSGFSSIDLLWAGIGYAAIAAHIIISFFIEKFATKSLKCSNNCTSNITIKNQHMINSLLLLGGAALNSWFNIWNPFISAAPLFVALIVFLKLISYILVNSDLRKNYLSGEKNVDTKDDGFNSLEIKYPDNINIGNLSYFIFAPTLSYQPVYPRTPKIRPLFIFKRSIEFCIAFLAMVFLGEQYAGPVLKNSINVLESGNTLHIFERLLKLSVISVLMWLLMFWAFFHCYMNIIAEILRFGDRRFYLSWWNAKDISEYWRLWNNPVYSWGKRHIYLSLNINHKTNRFMSMLAVFTVSAILHEVLIGIPTHCINGIAFLGMMGQIPMILLTNGLMSLQKRYFPGQKEMFDTLGNVIFWVSFTILGQPACILIYYSQWYYKNHKMIQNQME